MKHYEIVFEEIVIEEKMINFSLYNWNSYIYLLLKHTCNIYSIIIS